MNLCEIRKKKGYTQSALGTLVGVTQQQIAKYESGISMPSKKVILALAHELDLTLYEVWALFYDDQRAANQPHKAEED